MSIEHSPARATDTAISGGVPAEGDAAFWHELINERAAGQFLGLTDRTLQALRQRGGGPCYLRLSARCLRYRRADLRAWVNERIRTSTSDPGADQADPCHVPG